MKKSSHTVQREVALFVCLMLLFSCPLMAFANPKVKSDDRYGAVKDEQETIGEKKVRIYQYAQSEKNYVLQEINHPAADASQDAEAALPTVSLVGWSESDGYQYVLFGRYRQEAPDQPLLWRVLGVQNGYALLLSELIIGVMPFDGWGNDWATSDVHDWLNHSFFQEAFTEGEKTAIVASQDVGALFLPSRGEMTNTAYGFKAKMEVEDANRVACASLSAVDSNAWINPEGLGSSPYYLRTAPNKSNVDMVRSTGYIGVARIDRDNVGIRPAMWVSIEELHLAYGEGTFDVPFQ